MYDEKIDFENKMGKFFINTVSLYIVIRLSDLEISMISPFAPLKKF